MPALDGNTPARHITPQPVLPRYQSEKSTMLERYAASNPKVGTRLSLGFAFSSWTHILATFFGSGLLRPAPGTMGTLAGLLVYVVCSDLGKTVWIAITLLSFFLGAYACEISGRDCGVHDHSSFVIDEVFAIWLVLLTLPASPFWYVAAFVTFRFFDIVKVPPSSWFDRTMRNGWGVMLDDFSAAVQSILVLQGVLLLVS